MKILYALQATGNGHISRANELIPVFEKYAEVDVLVSGYEANLSLYHAIKYKCRGVSFVFGKKGGIDFIKTYKKLDSKKFLEEVSSLPVENYDLVVNDFEPVSAWACKKNGVPCIALSHQYAILQDGAPRPKICDPLSKIILNNFAPAGIGFGIHFRAYQSDIFTPVIRKAIREAVPANHGHYTVYLPAYSDKKLLKLLQKFSAFQFQIFSREAEKMYDKKNCIVFPINGDSFTSSFANCEGIICGAGFETPAEAIFMGKKILAVPMKNQLEQQCNAAALKELGIPIIKKKLSKSTEKIEHWLKQNHRVQIQYADNKEAMINKVLSIPHLKFISQDELKLKLLVAQQR